MKNLFDTIVNMGLDTSGLKSVDQLQYQPKELLEGAAAANPMQTYGMKGQSAQQVGSNMQRGPTHQEMMKAQQHVADKHDPGHKIVGVSVGLDGKTQVKSAVTQTSIVGEPVKKPTDKSTMKKESVDEEGLPFNVPPFTPYGQQPINEAVIATVQMTMPLFIRLMEWSREDAKDDAELHKLAENLAAINSTATMDDYDKLLNFNVTEMTDAQWERAKARDELKKIIAKKKQIKENDLDEMSRQTLSRYTIKAADELPNLVGSAMMSRALRATTHNASKDGISISSNEEHKMKTRQRGIKLAAKKMAKIRREMVENKINEEIELDENSEAEKIANKALQTRLSKMSQEEKVKKGWAHPDTLNSNWREERKKAAAKRAAELDADIKKNPVTPGETARAEKLLAGALKTGKFMKDKMGS